MKKLLLSIMMLTSINAFSQTSNKLNAISFGPTYNYDICKLGYGCNIAVNSLNIQFNSSADKAGKNRPELGPYTGTGFYTISVGYSVEVYKYKRSLIYLSPLFGIDQTREYIEGSKYGSLTYYNRRSSFLVGAKLDYIYKLVNLNITGSSKYVYVGLGINMSPFVNNPFLNKNKK